MKKYKVQIITAIITVLFLSLVTIGFTYAFGVKESYQLSSEVALSNSNGIIDGYIVDYDDFKNEDGDFQLKIEVGSNETRDIDFEISSLVNFEQQYFRTPKSEVKIPSSILSVKQDKKELIVILDKEAFKQHQNQLVINIRQDIKELSYKNDLVRDSNTLNFTYYVTNKEGEVNNDKAMGYRIDNLAQNAIEEGTQNVIFDISTNNNDHPLIEIKQNKDIPVNLSVGGQDRHYIVWAYIDSKQVKINGHPFVNIDVEKNMIGTTNLKIENPVKPGIYELEVFCVPAPYEQISSDLKEVLSGKRYTVKVE